MRPKLIALLAALLICAITSSAMAEPPGTVQVGDHVAVTDSGALFFGATGVVTAVVDLGGPDMRLCLYLDDPYLAPWGWTDWGKADESEVLLIP